MNNLRAVIFDMDGLLLDTEKISAATFIVSCRDCGLNPDIGVYHKCIGTTFARTKEILIEGYGKDFPVETVLRLWNKRFLEETENKSVPLKAGAMSLLKYLDNQRLRKVVVTSTRREAAIRELTNAQILLYFDFVLGGDQIPNGKPHPDIYLQACRQLNEEPSQCLAIEDSDNGVISASKAGLMVIQVPDLVEPSDKVKALGHRIIKSLIEVETLLKSFLKA